MNIKVLKLIALIFITFFTIFSFKYIKNLQHENKRLNNNQSVLLDSIQFYKVSDSLNVAKVNQLELSLADYKKYRAEDAALIKKLKADKLSASTSISTVNTTSIKTVVKDSIVYIDKIVPVDTLKCINFNSKWTSINGFISNDTLSLDIINREELLIAESFVKKRFLGLKLPIWLFGYKTKSIDAVSKNPNTIITDLEFIHIYK